MSLKEGSLTGLNIRSIWDTNICQISRFSGWPDKYPASSYLEIRPLVANRSGATWKGLPLALLDVHEKSSQAFREDKGQGRDSLKTVRHVLRFLF